VRGCMYVSEAIQDAAIKGQKKGGSLYYNRGGTGIYGGGTSEYKDIVISFPHAPKNFRSTKASTPAESVYAREGTVINKETRIQRSEEYAEVKTGHKRAITIGGKKGASLS